MKAVPAEIPATVPEDDPTEATPGSPELHVPPGETSAKVVDAPTHIPDAPVIGETEFTVIVRDTMQLPILYVIAAYPPETPVTSPDKEPIVAIPGVAETHVPPGMPSSSVTVAPMHTDAGPVMAVGAELTVIDLVAMHPVLNV